MKIVYKADKEHNNTVKTKEPKARNKSRLGAKLLISLAILVIAVAVKANMPDAFRSASEKLNRSVDFISAFNAVEEGLSGEVKMSDAVKSACRYAFIGTDENEFAVLKINENVEKTEN